MNTMHIILILSIVGHLVAVYIIMKLYQIIEQRKKESCHIVYSITWKKSFLNFGYMVTFKDEDFNETEVFIDSTLKTLFVSEFEAKESGTVEA